MLRLENINKLNELEIYKKLPFEFEDGWTDLVFELGNNIMKLCELTNCELPRVVQVKSKFGALRFYYGTSDYKYPEIVEKCISLLVNQAEDMSAYTCEKCGKRGKLQSSKDGLWFTACKEHEGIYTGKVASTYKVKKSARIDALLSKRNKKNK